MSSPRRCEDIICSVNARGSRGVAVAGLAAMRHSNSRARATSCYRSRCHHRCDLEYLFAGGGIAAREGEESQIGEQAWPWLWGFDRPLHTKSLRKSARIALA
jgi:hypothetical protein